MTKTRANATREDVCTHGIRDMSNYDIDQRHSATYALKQPAVKAFRTLIEATPMRTVSAQLLTCPSRPLSWEIGDTALGAVCEPGLLWDIIDSIALSDVLAKPVSVARTFASFEMDSGRRC